VPFQLADREMFAQIESLSSIEFRDRFCGQIIKFPISHILL
jgi:hypothetical protein